MEARTSVPPGQAGSGYSGAAAVGAAFATVLFPLIALIVALLLLIGEHDPQKRIALRRWAWVSGGWLVLVSVVLLILQNVTIR